MSTPEQRLCVATIRRTGTVAHLRLGPSDGRPLGSFTPGSHILIQTPASVNAYSLTGPHVDPGAYEISVQRHRDRGGSAWLHQLSVGHTVSVSGPVSGFAPVLSAAHHLFIVGGIGVTPILSHVRAAVTGSRSFEVIDAHRPGPAAHRDELTRLCGSRLTTVTDRGALLQRLTERLADQPLGTIAYLCGPAEMMAAVRALADRLGWPAERIRSEAFTGVALAPGRPFRVRLARSRRRVAVAAGVSLLEALETAGIAVPHRCRQGVCGECRVGVLAGRPEHRDLYLTESERASGDALMACVSRCLDDELELAL
ncbi:PDR/VanB family oxidoreductase [Conexibacter sp. DBS9H8]|uniref:PDR/VanB family oxidoreductase n=1 Tax=Conexibacter sp. DBS9H8 TaxID=2937801 RepID=UPI00200E2C8B|nr:PDR/VanB family oxidoreductase [Conexibacter sp. DBS9H8]